MPKHEFPERDRLMHPITTILFSVKCNNENKLNVNVELLKNRLNTLYVILSQSRITHESHK